MARLNSIGIVGAPPYCSTFTSERIGNSHQSYQFGTFTLPHFTSLHKLWYKQVDGKNIQVLPDNVAYLLTPIAIGYWLASDGSYSQRDAVVTIYTDSFSPDEVVYSEGFCLSGMASFLHDTRMVTLRSSSWHESVRLLCRSFNVLSPSVNEGSYWNVALFSSSYSSYFGCSFSSFGSFVFFLPGPEAALKGP